MAKEKNETVQIDFGSMAKKIYELDPDWVWVDQRKKDITFENLPARRKLELINAAQGLAAFANSFERDIPLSGLIELFNSTNRFGAKVDEES